MLKTYIYLYCCLLITCFGCSEKYTFETDAMRLELDNKGFISSITSKKGINYLFSGQPSPLLAIRINNHYENPSSMTWDKTMNSIRLTYDHSHTEITIRTEEKANYLTFEVIDIRSDQYVELAVWGPYHTTISKTIGECVGVVRDSSYAIGIQALNPKTIGGYPSTEDDVEPSYDIFASTSLVDVADSVSILYRGQTARHTESGSILQAYCRDRSKDRIIPMWEHEKYLAPAFDDGGITGSKIALFACPVGETLDYLEKIELGEDLPHPMLNGEWMKRSPEASQAYLIYPFNEENIEEAIALTKKAGLKYLYHGEPFETWGNFKLNPKEFPSGYEGLKQCVEKAEKEDIRLGIHTLSNFITSNDAYVTPLPDKRLAQVGSTILVSDINFSETSVIIESPDFFNQMTNNNLHCVRLGNELIRYESVSGSSPWILENCSRGAFGTTAAAHQKGDTIVKLMDHGYKTFLTNADLTKEVARNIADIFNKTGIRQISFDGLEGAWSTGLGQYGLSLMIKEWYDHLLPEYRDAINDASMTTHYNWHTFTRMNWGEPWYAGFRESQLNYRLMNQDFYRRNLIPCMLGWFRLDKGTSIEDIEWLLARSAAFDAGYTLVTNKENVTGNGQSEHILTTIREWEKARLNGAFPTDLKKEMEHVDNEYTLNTASPGIWKLSPFRVQRFNHPNMVRQPGEPSVSKCEFENPYQRQPIRFILKTTGSIHTLSLEIANYSTITIPLSLKPDQYLKYDGGTACYLYDKNWNLLQSFPVDPNKMYMPEGKSQLIISCSFETTGNTGLTLSGELKTIGEAIELKATRQIR